MIPQILIHPNSTVRQKEIEKILTTHSLSKSHPDLLFFEEGEKLGVEQAKKIREFLGLKPYQAEQHAVAIISAGGLTHDAQNALLKILEEPNSEAVILLGIASDEQLLPTILSRCQVVNLQGEKEEDNKKQEKFSQDIAKLMEASTEGRFVYIEKLGDKREEFLPALVSYYRNLLLKIPTPQIKEYLSDLIKAEKMVSANVNLRAVLEYLMLKLPKI